MCFPSPQFEKTSVNRPAFRARKNARGFSLIELLVVMAIILLLASLGIGTIGGGNEDQDKTLIAVGNALESARQLAVSQNTYTYVGFTSPASAQLAGAPLCIGVFQSGTGEDILRNALLSGQALANETTAAAQNQWKVACKPVWLRNVSLQSTLSPDSGLIPGDELIDGKFSDTAKTLPSGLGFSLSRKMGNMPSVGTLLFDRVITFSPSGVVFVDNLSGMPQAVIGFLISPSRGDSPTAGEKAKIAALTINGLLGNNQIYKFATQ